MKKYYRINDYIINIWRKNLKYVMDNCSLDKSSVVYQKIEGVEHQLGMFMDTSSPLPYEDHPDITKRDLMDKLGYTDGFDSALPQDWVDDVRDVTGEYPIFDFCWDCNKWVPVPITRKGSLILRIYMFQKQKENK